jgi:transposase-like protein
MEKQQLIDKYIKKELSLKQLENKLHKGKSQTLRLVAKYKKDGQGGLIHGLIGKPSNHTSLIPKTLEDTITSLYKQNYVGFGPTLCSEYLLEQNSIDINRETLRLILIKHKLWKPKHRKGQTIRTRREPKQYYGEMIQYDGSYHKWFGNIETCLLIAIDDNSKTIMNGMFCKDEGVNNTFIFWKEYIQKNGAPESIYLDKFSTYKNVLSDDPEKLTQFQVICKELGIEVIHANSPQAKGRVERSFRTLQDRLVKYLAFKKVETIDEANIELQNFIQKYNDKFSLEITKDLHIKTNVDLEKTFRHRHARKVNKDFTISYKGKCLQLIHNEGWTIIRNESVVVEEDTDGNIYIYSPKRNVYLEYSTVKTVSERRKTAL